MDHQRWKPAERFTPTPNDMMFVRQGCFAQEEKMSLIVKWRSEAERQAINAIFLMMYNGLLK